MRQAMGDISKLPKWAQRHIEVLEKNLRFAKEQNRLQVEGKTDVFLLNYGQGASYNNIPLPPDSTIVFDLGGPEHRTELHARVVERVHEAGGVKKLEIMASGEPHHIIVESQSGNVITVANLDLRNMEPSR